MSIKKPEEIFRRLGMSKHAYSVYEAARKNPGISATGIVSATSAHRPAAYRAIEELIQAKLLIRVRKGKRYGYESLSEKRVIELFSKEIKDAKEVLPQTNVGAKEVVNSTMKLFHGPEGIRAVFDDVVNHMPRAGTFFRYTSERDLNKVNSYLSPGYRAIRDRKRLERQVISNQVSGSRKKPRLERFIKYIPKEVGLFDQNIIQLIYGVRTAFIDLNTEECMIIENAALAEFQKVIFKQLYKKL